MIKVLFVAALVGLSAASASVAGNCAHSYDRASDGSSCGGRAADQRDGGN